MPTKDALPFNPWDVFFLIPHIVLTVWGLLVLLVDVGLARRLNADARRRTTGLLALVGVGLALIAAGLVAWLSLSVRAQPEAYADSFLPAKFVDYLSVPDPSLFFGTLAGDSQTTYFNVLYIFLLGFVVWLSTAWTFTEEWGEYFALMFWATVGMMLLTASEELTTLFVTLETMTICLYLSTAFEKTRRRSAEGGLKYFVYGSVSSALFLFGLSMLYGLTGTTYFDGIRQVLSGLSEKGLAGNVAGATAILLMFVGFGFKVAAVPFHQWAPDAYEGAPAPVTAWIATGSKLASFVALMKVFLHALLPWSHPTSSILGPGWLAIVAVIAAVTMTYGNLAALAQRNFKRMLAYSSIAHAGYILVGVAAASVAFDSSKAVGAVLYYLVVYALANVGAFAAAAWLVRDRNTDDIDDLNGLGYQEPLLAGCLLVIMLSLIGIPPLAGFFGKLYVFMEALDQQNSPRPVTLLWLVALGLFNSVISAFYYVRVLKAMYLREPGPRPLRDPGRPIAVPILVGAAFMLILGIVPDMLLGNMQACAVPMLASRAPMAELVVAPPPRDASGNIIRPSYPPVQYSKTQKSTMRSPTGSAPQAPAAEKASGAPKAGSPLRSPQPPGGGPAVPKKGEERGGDTKAAASPAATAGPGAMPAPEKSASPGAAGKGAGGL